MDDLNKDLAAATVALIEMIKPIIKYEDAVSAAKLKTTLDTVIQYPDLSQNDKMVIISNVVQYLIRACGAQSILTETALVAHHSCNKMIS